MDKETIKTTPLQGVFTALVTPFTTSNQLDTTTYAALIERQIEAGVAGIVPVGTTGESSTLDSTEYEKIIEIAVRQANGRVLVIVGAGTNNTAKAIALSKIALDNGADATLQVNPYYNKPNQQGLYRHFATIADTVDIPMVLYNIPGRSGVSLNASTTLKLFEHPNIISIKDATGSVSEAMELIPHLPANRSVLSGDDKFAFPLLTLGSQGLVSVAANVIPQQIVALVSDALGDHLNRSRAMHYRLLPLLKAFFYDTNPIPVKYVMARMGLLEEVYRLPLSSTTANIKKEIDVIAESYQLYNKKNEKHGVT